MYSIAFDHTGRALYFAADHGDHNEIHALSLDRGVTAVQRGRLQTLDSGTEPYGPIVVSEFDNSPRVAFLRGDCSTSLETYVSVGGSAVEAVDEEGSSQPIGWLPDGRLVFLQADTCNDEPGTLAVYSQGFVEHLVPGLDVGDAAIRAALPPPPAPPEERLPPAITA